MIGIFDSGSGGLTVLREIKKVLPKTDIVYFGDFRNAPYGNKTPEELGVLTVLGIQRLLSLGATQIVTACNSVSSSILKPMFDYPEIKQAQIIEMVGPTTRALSVSKDKRILLVATEATVRSGIYQDSFRDAGIFIDALPLPHLAGGIEEGTSIPGMVGMIRNSLDEVIGGYDTLVLGCTHYPLVRDIFEQVAPGVEIFDPAEAIAKEVEKNFDGEGDGKIKFVISKDSKFFRDKVLELFGLPAEASAQAGDSPEIEVLGWR